ncbi:MAG: hypothetical protein ABGY41_08155, partial [Candidatus Poribacteria bacterium]
MLSDVRHQVRGRWRGWAAWATFLLACVTIGVVGGRHSTGYLLPLMVGGAFVGLAVVAPRLCLLATVAVAPFSFR